ncbi:MAG: BamA/TamA family outer membrane protein [Pseudoflavonifractor sp.]|nr:BamA/TamA family outer membrane protein [Alloprevotella sp.]MCM1116185.1 BamA/TamA family outer membrane protein [Pseudoflavonifractor sp.]
MATSRTARQAAAWAIAIVHMALLLLAGACSTTSRLPKDEILYTGVKKIAIEYPRIDSLPKAPDLAGDIKDAVNVAPNNSLISPYVRYPFPIGLWVYNHWDNPKSGFKHWLYEKLVAEPVLISDVRPEVRTEMIDQILDNNGYFRGHASYSLVQGKNKKKASIRYEVTTGRPYLIDSIEYLPDSTRLCQIIDSVARRSEYFQPGSRYSTDSLAQLRVNIANAVRNKGYYFFKPDYIEYLADSTITPERITMRLTMASNTPPIALQKWVTGDIRTTIYRNQGDGTPDTIMTRKGELIVMRPSKLREGLIPSCITFRQGRTFTVREMNRTQTYLSRLGIFNSIDISVFPDTTAAIPTLDVDIQCTFDAPLEASLEINATSKSNSYIGPGLIFSVTNRNIFGGGEQLSVALKGSYEWQTGRDRGRSVFNSYEIGLSGTLSFPRLIAPRFIPRSRREVNWTRIGLSADLLNRPHYFRMAQLNTSFAYDWRVNRNVVNTYTPLKLTYTKLIHTTTDFDSIMGANPAIAQSFMTQFIPQMMYNITYDKDIDRNNTINIQIGLQEAGNLLWAIYRACGDKGEKRLFGTPFSQFVKAQAQVVFGCRIIGKSWLYSRVAVGAAHAYGNSSQVPYSEQFYVGGANSVRAFTVRSLGPGSYRPADDVVNGYFDQTGTFKFEANLEYRFPIYGPLHGALFIDSGNVWLLKADPQRPGGKLEGHTFFKDLALGTGAGLRVDIGMLVIRGDLGIGIHAPYKTSRHGYYNMTSFGNSLAFHLAIGYPF